MALGCLSGQHAECRDVGPTSEDQPVGAGTRRALIIRGGRNYYPQDVERVIEGLEGARLGGVIAFGRFTDTGEQVVAIVERGTSDEETLATLPERARRAVLDALGLMIDDVAVQPRGWVPKTTSAKLQRSKARDLYEAELGA